MENGSVSSCPPTLKLVLKVSGTSGPGGADIRDSHRQGGTLYDGAAGDGAALLLLSPGFLGPSWDRSPSSHPSRDRCRESLGWEPFVRLPSWGQPPFSLPSPLPPFLANFLSASELTGSSAGRGRGRGAGPREPPLGFGSCLSVELALSSSAATPHPRDLRGKA